MYSVVKRIQFCYGHRLLDYDGKCAYAHGHNATVEVELVSEHLDSRGMVYDFAEVSRILNKFIENTLDHRMLLREDDPLVEALRKIGEEPFIMKSNPTAENIARLIFEEAKDRSLPVLSVRFWETENAFAEYRL